MSQGPGRARRAESYKKDAAWCRTAKPTAPPVGLGHASKAGAKAGFEKIGSHPDANGEHLFQKVKARKLVPPNLGVRTRQRLLVTRGGEKRLLLTGSGSV